jgi:predicted house-cleaning noncanonical NTP pyrophosphatase (MazG superfamily)
MVKKRRFKMETLVRDKMPKRLAKLGVYVESHSLHPKDQIDHLKLKLQEEVDEIIEAVTPKDIKEEIADVLEVLYSIAKYYNLQIDHLEKKRLQKQGERGGYSKGLFVEFVEVDVSEEPHPVIEYCLANPDKYPEITD